MHAPVKIIPTELLLMAYRSGIFPMSDSRDDEEIYWVEPRERGIIPLDNFHVPSRLARTVRADQFEIRIDSDFDGVIAGCAAPAEGRDQTWINARIRDLYGALFDSGHAHTVEAWENGRLVGGLYGVRLGAAFFGESMFHTARDASKVALVHLVARLRAGGFQLLDTQFVTDHLARFGAREVPRRTYRALLDQAVAQSADFFAWPKEPPVPGAQALAEIAKPWP